MNQPSDRITRTFRVTGFSQYGDSLKKLAKLNPDWNLSPEEIVNSGKVGQKIYKLKFTNSPVLLQPESGNPNAIAVIVAGYQIGYINKEEASQVKSILTNCNLQSISCGIWGGLSRTVDEFYCEDTQNQGISIIVRIVYTDLSALCDDDFAGLLIEEKPDRSVSKKAKTKKKKAKKPIFKRWWFWVIIILFLAASCGSSGDSPEETVPSTFSSEIQNDPIASPTDAETSYIPETEAMTEAVIDDSVSLGEKNALRAAHNYINIMPFSYSGLIDQLEFEGYSFAEAKYGADNCGADWKEQALKSAKNYIRIMAFSYDGLIEQLEFEGYSADEATYGADNCGADWFDEAAESAKNYLNVMAFSRQELIEQLEFEGFTNEQAVHGVTENGY